MPLYALDDAVPEVDPTAWIAPTAILIGKVKVEAGATIWWGAVLRGDNEPIVVGRGSNVQEGCVMHTDPGFPLTVAEEVTVGHLAMLHGCTIGKGSLVGIGATILNGAVIGERCLIGAHALVPEKRAIPDASLVMGAPAKIVKDVTPEQAQRMARGTATYVSRGAHYRTALREVR